MLHCRNLQQGLEGRWKLSRAVFSPRRALGSATREAKPERTMPERCSPFAKRPTTQRTLIRRWTAPVCKIGLDCRRTDLSRISSCLKVVGPGRPVDKSQWSSGQWSHLQPLYFVLRAIPAERSGRSGQSKHLV